MTGYRLGPVGAELPVPPGQVEAEIAVGLARHHRVMDPMHLRGGHDLSQHAVEALRKADVAVVEYRGGIEQHLEDQHRRRWRAERGNDAKLDRHGEQDLDRMEARACRCRRE